MDRKKLIITATILLSFIGTLVTLLLYLDAAHDARRLDPLELESMTKEQIIASIYERQATNRIPFYYLIPMFAFFGIGIGALLYWIFAENIERKERIIEQNTDIILQLLDPDERKVVKKCIEYDGKVQQVEISYMEGFSKVKAHRVIENLVQKGIIVKETLGKMRLLHLNKDLLMMFRKKDT